MASGKNHDLSILFATPIVGIVGASMFSLELGVIATASHFLGGYMLSPDLDLRSNPFYRWGFLKLLWIPYQKLIPRHRHWLSHGIVVGSLIRLAYLTALLLPFWFLIPGLQEMEWAINQHEAIAFLVGVELSALNHLLLDGMLIPLPKLVKEKLKKG